ncbi:MAG: alcohol dehydrogenase catalytic domain-containing protein [Desulfobacterota bacterium]|nr:alcohol dehydrogenase catalytic domain-containing protein [Thermodesulfobacteriota bacterium]
MKALVKTAPEAGAFEVKEVPMPKPGLGEILVEVKAASLCYTDVAILENKYKGRKPVPIPIVLGHEGAGVVAALGEGVENVSVGDRVGMEAVYGCGICVNCLNGNTNMCPNWRHVGITYDGVFAEYVVVPARAAHKLPDHVSFIDAACLEPISLTVRTMEQVKPMVGDTVVIFGPGAIGLFHLQAFKAAGASQVIMIGIDQDANRFEKAKELGADHILNVQREDVVQRVRELTEGLGADIVVETASSPAVIPLTIEVAAAKGRVSFFGLYPEATLSPLTIARSGLRIFGDAGSLPRYFVRAVRWLKDRKVQAAPLATRVFRLEEAKEALEASRRGEVAKVIFEI